MENFFERVSRVWPAGRRDLHWHILPTRQEADRLSTPFKTFPRPGLAGVPAEWMHCTVLHAIGLNAADVDIEELVAATTRRVREREVEPFTLTFDRPAIGTVGMELSGWPGQPFDDLVDHVTAATTKHAPAGAFRPSASRYPHMATAYTTAGVDHMAATDLRQELAHLDGPVSGTVLVDRLHLVDQVHDGSRITWQPLAQVPLGGTP